MRGLRTLWLSLATGFILFFYSERLFWTVLRPDESLAENVVTWLAYSLLAYIFLCAVKWARARAGLFLAGALFGWLCEGTLAGTLYGTEPSAPLPLCISHTGLSWHALISVMVGWYGVRWTLLQNNLRRTLQLTTGIGLFWAIWAVFPLQENPPLVTSIPGFLKGALLTTLPLVFAYWLHDRCHPEEFTPNPIALGGCALLLAMAFAGQVAALGILPLLILPPLLLLLRASLRAHRASEEGADFLLSLSGPIADWNYIALTWMPLAATLGYALGSGLATLPLPPLIYLVLAVAGFVALARCLKAVWGTKGGSPDADERRLSRARS
ncbi:MAG: hypothetical protein HY319_00980 [Armatimonadetes bacterium]|nr:hypothetical protein [Armatimonadota bacterium]